MKKKKLLHGALGLKKYYSFIFRGGRPEKYYENKIAGLLLEI
jgi:hypothetical protein